MYPSTYHGLQSWYKHEYKHLGWMLLAKERSHKTKVRAYLESIDRLESALAERARMTRDDERRYDLSILLQNTRILKKGATKLLK